MLVCVQVVNEVGLRVVPADADVAGVEDLAQLVADEVDDRLEVELGGHAFLDAVDHGQFGGALLRFLQQALRLVEEARVLQRHAHARGDGAQQPHVGFAEGVLALVILQVDHAEHAVAAEDRDVDRRNVAWSVPGRRCRRPSAASSARVLTPTAAASRDILTHGSLGSAVRRHVVSRLPCS